jgi:acyl-CoA synthetase (AMP-forming)/AMP-acid ligase II
MLERERVTMFRGWPDQAARMGAHADFATTDLSSLKAGSLAGVLPPDERPAPGARANLFGMTESCGPYCGAPLDVDMPATAHGSCGQPFDGIEVRIVPPGTGDARPAGTGNDRAASGGAAPDDAGSDNESGTADTGEIQLRGPNLMRGIHGRDRSTVFTADGFFPTGDLGRVDEDGYLWFSGRLDDMFKVHGANVYPSEVETALEEIAYVRRAFVVDIGGADARRVGAAVVLDNDAHAPADLDADARRALSSFKVPARWAIIGADDVPRAATGKVDKDGLRRLIESA